MNIHNLDYLQPLEELNYKIPTETPDDIIKDENKRYLKRIKQLEERALNAENGYKELYALKYTVAEEELKELKIIATERLTSSNREMEKLLQLINSYDLRIAYLKEELKNTNNALLSHLPAKVNKGSITYESIDMWKEKCENIQKESEIQQMKVNEMRQKVKKMKLAHLTLFYQDTNQLKILKQGRTDQDEDYYICQQSGRYGTLKFKLTFFKTNDQLKVNYQPLFDPELDKTTVEKLPIYIKEEIDFKQSDAVSFFWKMLTIINRKENNNIDI